MATACLAAVALGLNFSLDQGSLTVALALSSLGAAYVEHRLDIPALRKAVCAMGLIIAARLAWDPRIVGDDLGTTPILNWLLFGYGVPAISFGLAARMLGKRSQDRCDADRSNARHRLHRASRRLRNPARHVRRRPVPLPRKPVRSRPLHHHRPGIFVRTDPSRRPERAACLQPLRSGFRHRGNFRNSIRSSICTAIPY